MDKPKIGKTYIFVRPKGDGFEHSKFLRWQDGSAGFFADGFNHVHEGNPNAWQEALAALAQLGFVELGEAKVRGLIASSWSVPQEQ